MSTRIKRPCSWRIILVLATLAASGCVNNNNRDLGNSPSAMEVGRGEGPVTAILKEITFSDPLLAEAFHKIDVESARNGVLFPGKDLLMDFYQSSLDNNKYYLVCREFAPDKKLIDKIGYFIQESSLRFISTKNIPANLFKETGNQISITLEDTSSWQASPELYSITYVKGRDTVYSAGNFKTILSYSPLQMRDK